MYSGDYFALRPVLLLVKEMIFGAVVEHAHLVEEGSYLVKGGGQGLCTRFPALGV